MAYLQQEIGEKKMTDGIDAATAALLSGQNNNNGMGMGGIGGGLVGGLLGGLLFGNNRGFGGGFGGGYGGGSPAAAAVATDIVLSPALQSVQTQLSNLSSQVNSNAIIDQIQDGFTNIDSDINGVNMNVSNNSRDILSSIAGVATAQASNNFLTLQSINSLGRDVTAQANQNALQQLNSFNQLNTTVLQSFNENSRDNANAFNLVQASLNNMAAANAACCCEIKSEIASDGGETRALINALNVQNLQAQLADAKQANTTLNQTITTQGLLAAQTNTILHHLIPESVIV